MMKHNKTSIEAQLNPKCVILRGISGSGKSTFIAKNLQGAEVCSADNFPDLYEGPDKVFNPKKLGDAHRWCMQKFIRATTHLDPIGRANLVVVDNTNLMLWEFMGYVQIAGAMGYEVQIIQMDTPVHIAAKRNVHGVSMNKVEDMSRRFQRIPPFLGLNEKIVKGV